MLFNSFEFLFFFLLVLAGLALLRGEHRHEARKRFLVVASWVFYASWSPPFLLLLLFTTCLDFTLARAIVRAAGPRRRLLLIVSITANLGLLAFFKYGNFFATTAWYAFHGAGGGPPPVFLDVLLPLGISFYTFESLAYVIDVYRGAVPAERLLDYALFIAFFPHLIAGPIVRPSFFLPQLVTPPRPDTAARLEAIRLIAVGLFKKVVCADLLGQYVDVVYGYPSVYTGLDTIVGLYAYTFQIYFDFSGYSDIAIGLAAFLGYRLPQNFDRPFAAASPAEFWRRWHITLSTWLRDYLYIPLGGNRRGGLRTYVNLLVTMGLGGLWHGANYTFVLWGLYHGALLCLHRLLRERGWLDRLPAAGFAGRAFHAAGVLLTFHLVVLGFALFRAASLQQFMTLLGGAGLGQASLTPEEVAALVILAGAVASHVLGGRRDWPTGFTARPAWMQAAAYAALTLIALVFAPEGTRFIYFQF